MIRRPPRSTQGVSSAASDVYKRQGYAEARNSSPKNNFSKVVGVPGIRPQTAVYPFTLIVDVAVEGCFLVVRHHLNTESKQPKRQSQSIPYPQCRCRTGLTVDDDNDIHGQEHPQALHGPRYEKPNRRGFESVKTSIFSSSINPEIKENGQAQSPDNDE